MDRFRNFIKKVYFTSFGTRLDRSDQQPPVSTRGLKVPGHSDARTLPIDFGNYHALVIGNNDYSEFPKLKTAVNDAEAVATLLQVQYGFDVKLLVNATRSGILTALSDFRKQLESSANLLIYYAGHGKLDRGADRGYWLPVDAGIDNPSNWIANQDITSQLKPMHARHVLVVADSCYSGTLTRSAEADQVRTGGDEWIERIARKRSRNVLTSGELEPVLDSGGGKHSVFAKAFLDTLRENNAVADMDGLYNSIKRLVAANADQQPLYEIIHNADHEFGDFVFLPVTTGQSGKVVRDYVRSLLKKASDEELDDAELATITVLELDYKDVHDADLEYLEKFPQLRELSLSSTNITDAGLIHLGPLQVLEELALSGTRVSDAGLEHLNSLNKLRMLWLKNTQISDAGLERLASLSELKCLSLTGTRISDDGLVRLQELKTLRELSLGDTQITDEGLKHLGKISSLRRLFLERVRITDEGLKHLEDLDELFELRLTDTLTTEAGHEELCDWLPSVRIT